MSSITSVVLVPHGTVHPSVPGSGVGTAKSSCLERRISVLSTDCMSRQPLEDSCVLRGEDKPQSCR